MHVITNVSMVFVTFLDFFTIFGAKNLGLKKNIFMFSIFYKNEVKISNF